MPTDSAPSGAARRAAWPAFVGVFLLFAVYASVRSPLPGVNEPHYLCKAKHFWDPAWCPGDVFLESANAHAVFFAIAGALTRVLPLETVAMIGRLAVWSCLAWGWCRMCLALCDRESPQQGISNGQCPMTKSQLVIGHWSLVISALWPIASAAIFLVLSSLGSLSGEWVIGGVEAKGFSYAALWIALADVACGRLVRAAFWSGVAVSLHPVVGVWGTFACIGGAMITGVGSRFAQRFSLSETRSSETTPDPLPIPRPQVLLLAGLAWFLASLPGLIPAIVLVLSAPRDLAAEADRIQVTVRIAHHLDPLRFPAFGWRLMGMEILLFAALAFTRPTRGERVLRGAVWTAILIGLGGLIIGFGPRNLGLMKFYPFRIADVLVPAAVALCVVAALQRLSEHRPALRVPFVTALAAAAAFAGSLLAPCADRNPSKMDPAKLRDWIAACEWIRSSTPADSLVFTPRSSYAFKWYAHRAEYVVGKDCPQDAASLLEWNRRRSVVAAWSAKAKEAGYPREMLEAFARENGIDYMVTAQGVVTSLKPLYSNTHFDVFDVK